MSAAPYPGSPVAPIPVPRGDPWMSNYTANGTVNPNGSRTVLKFKRSAYVRDAAGVRQQINHVTHFLDASAVYGQSEGALSFCGMLTAVVLLLLLLLALLLQQQHQLL